MQKHPTSISQYRRAPMVMGLTAGLVAAQVIGTLQVGWSNRVLFSRNRAVTEAGYLAVPNELIEPGLLSFKAALGGGLFFTLTIGAFLTLLTIGWLQLSGGLFGRRTAAIGMAMGIIAGSVIMNFDGFNLFATAYVFFVPLAVGTIYRMGGTGSGRENKIFHSLCLLIPPIILILTWFPFLGHHTFTDVRDYILLSNSPGRIVNDFYYRYTLYPTESFKSLDQKQIRTFYLDEPETSLLDGPGQSSLKPVLTDILVARDYFPVTTINDGDVIVNSSKADFWELKAKGRAVSVPRSALLNRPDQTLDSLDDLYDKNRWFRKLIYISLLIGFPLLIYWIAFGATRRLLGWVFPFRWAAIGASVICVGLGVMLLCVLEAGKPAKSPPAEISDMAGASDRRKRLNALKIMDQKGIDISGYRAYASILKSGDISQRYWLARVLGHGRDEETYADLIQMLSDPSPNVVCMALRSLGKRGNRQAVPVILNRMQRSDHWYIQWYAHNALKALKWRQHPLK